MCKGFPGSFSVPLLILGIDLASVILRAVCNALLLVEGDTLLIPFFYCYTCLAIEAPLCRPGAFFTGILGPPALPLSLR